MTASGLDALPDVREWSQGLLECPGVVRRPSQKFGSGRETVPDVWEWLEALPDVQEWSGVPP